MASLRVLAFDHEGRLVAFDTWHDDLKLYLLSDIKDSVSLFDHMSSVALAPPATADVATRSQWLSPDATARLAIRNHLPVAKCTHFGQHRTPRALYDAVVACYSSPATAALGRLLLPYLFPELSAFATVADLVTHLRTSNARYRATVPADAEGDCYRCVPPDPGIVATALGASASGIPPGTAPAEALHTFTLDSSASRCFFRDSTTLTPLPAPVPVRLADLSGGPVVARSSTVLPCPAVPSGSLSGLHLPSFSTNLVSTAALHDAMVTTTTHGDQRVSICTCTQTGRRLATFTRRSGSSLYTLATEPPQVAPSAHVSTSGQVATSCSCRLLLHQTLLWHHRLGHPSLPRLRGMHSRFLVFGLHSCVSGQGRERDFLLVVDDYKRYTTVFPLHSKGEVADVLIPWIRTVRLQLRERFGMDLLVLRLHFDRGVMEVARTSMIHVAAPHFLWPFAIQYAAHQLNLWPRVSLPETSPTLRWTGKVGDASVFRVWGSRAFVCDTSVDKLSARAIPCDVTFNESVSFYHLFPYRSAPPPPPPLFLAPGPPPVEPLPPQGSAPSGVSQVDPLSGSAPVQVALGSSATPGTASRGATSGGAELGGAGSEGAGSGERREPASCPVLPVHTACRAIRSHPPHVPDTHAMALRPSSVPLRVPLPAPLESSLHEVPNRASDHSRATSPTVSHLLATAVTDPSFESASASALLAEMLYFVAACRLDYASALVAEFLSASPPSVRGECALGTDVLEDRREDFECLVAAVPRFTSVLLALEGNPDAQDIPTPCSYAEAITGTYVDEVPLSRANIVDGMWIFRVKRPPGSPPAFKARYVARGFS
ncbi:unnamed protein product [Closterium sp. NIES-54]